MNKLKNLSSFALISLNWEKQKKDFIELLKPFILFAIHPPSHELISISDISSKVQDEFGIKIPRNVIEFILNRLAKERIIKKENNSYKYITSYNLSDDVKSFIDLRDNHIKEQELVIDEFMSFCKHSLNLLKTRDESEEIIFNYFEKYSHNIFLNKTLDDIDINEENNYIMGRFLEYLVEEKQSVNLVLENIMKGFLIANSMYDHNIKIDSSKKNFKDTSIYFDTTFLFYTLGYNGDAMKESCIELLLLLEELGAKLRVHKHVIFELESILQAYIHSYNNNKLSTSYGFDYFIENQKTPSTVLVYKTNLEKNLASLNILTEDTPIYRNDNVFLDHNKLEEHLKNTINYSKDNAEIAINNDIESISSIYRLRGNKCVSDIEDCIAIFMTTNSLLVEETNKFINTQDKCIEYNYPPIITDISLTGIAWLKLPNKYPDLPKKYIIADAYSLQQPDRDFWLSYQETVEKLQKEELITEEDSITLRYEISKPNLMKITHGNKDKLSHSSIIELLEENKQIKQIELEKIITTKDKELVSKDKLIEKEILRINNFIDQESKKYAYKFTKKHHFKKMVINVVISLLLFVANVISFLDSIISKHFIIKILLCLALVVNIYQLLKNLKTGNMENKYPTIYNINYQNKKIELEKELIN